MISSAVVVPEAPPVQSPPNQPTSPSLKRRQSYEASEPDTSKRPRLDTVNTNGTQYTSPPPSATATSPPRRKSTLSAGGNEEKNRNRRLFGGLLSTLSASSSKPSSAHKRRDEIEQRQRERLKRDDEEITETRRKKREELDRVRRAEQRRWDDQSLRVRHANMRSMAGFLRTESEPRIYWRPWEMRPEEDDRVERQRAEVEETIKRETEGTERKDEGGGGREGQENGHDQRNVANGSSKQRMEADAPDAVEALGESTESQSEESSKAPGNESTADGPRAPEEVGLDDKGRDDDHGGDELLEGHDEDQVIY